MTPGDVLRALAAETERTADFLATLQAEDFARPTRCAPLTVLELGAHAWRGSGRIVEMIEAGPLDTEPERDAVTYFRYDADAEAPEIAARAREAGAAHDPAAFAATWRADWRAALETAAGPIERNGVYRSIFGLMHLSEYLRTRVLEVSVHTMDLRDALGLAPDPTEAGITVTADVLRGLLGTDPRALGIDDVRFVLAGTGREALDDTEREALGPLADLFPLLR